MRKPPERTRKEQPLSHQPQLVPERVPELKSEADASKGANSSAASTQPAAPLLPPEVKPLSAARYKVTFTATAELHDKLERLQALVRSSGDSGDLASVIEAAVTEKLEKLEAKRYGTTKSPRKSLEETDTSPSSRNIPAPVRRAVYARDLGRCTYLNPAGRRCTETKKLEFHHVQPFGRGGDHRPENICLLCRAHNALFAERDYGKKVMNRFRTSPNRVPDSRAPSPPIPVLCRG